jgi:hypothetical protein
MNHDVMRCSVNGNPARSVLQMKASPILGFTVSLLFAAPTPMWAAGNVATASEDSNHKNVFLKTMTDEMKDWRQRVGTYLATAEAKSEEAVPDLRAVWDRATTASHSLGLATEAGWDRAESAVEREFAALKAEIGPRQWRRPSVRGCLARAGNAVAAAHAVRGEVEATSRGRGLAKRGRYPNSPPGRARV